jgi:hypothetical protein
MDEEHLGSLGIAPQVPRAIDDFGDGHVSRKRLISPVFATAGAIAGNIHPNNVSMTSIQIFNLFLGLPALHNLLHPVEETIGVKLLPAMGWKPNQGMGEKADKKESQE